MEKLPSLNQKLKEYLECDSRIILMKNGVASDFSKPDLKKRILLARRTFEQNGLKQGDLAIFQINGSSKKALLSSFFALVSMGVAPVFLSAVRSKDHIHRLVNVAKSNPEAKIIADEETNEFVKLFWPDCDVSRMIVVPEEVSDYPLDLPSEIDYVDVDPESLALVIYSSGSTSDPKGIKMTHEKFTKMVLHLNMAAKSTSEDTWVQWLPLEHAFGLVSLIIFPMFFKSGVVHMNPADFIQNPKSWFDVIDKTRATMTAGPNFAYPLVMKFLDGSEKWDLSCLKCIFNGGEPISKIVFDKFTQTMAKFGMSEKVMIPLYGLTEAGGVVTLNMDFEYPELDADKITSGIDFDVKVLKKNIKDVACQGRNIPGMQMRICDDNNQVLPDNTIGSIQVYSDYMSVGYLNRAADDFLPDGWLDSGDLGFISNNLLYVVGRKKDMFFIHGKNVYLRDVEQVVTAKFGFRCAACGVNDSVNSKNDIYLFVESAEPEKVDTKSIKNHVFSEMGLRLNEVIPLSKLVLTGTGKIAKEKLLANYKEGKL